MVTKADSRKSGAAGPLAPSLRLRIGLSILDGASPQWIAETFGVTANDIDESWLLCRESLSRQFAGIDDGEYRLLDEAAIRERLDDALRLLLDWRATALQNERADALTPRLGVQTDQQSASESPDESVDEGVSDKTPSSE